MTEEQEDFKPEQLMSEEFWKSHGIEPVIIDPNDETTFTALVERIEAEVKDIQQQ